MRIFVAGATGVLGRRVVGLLVTSGHQVTGVARSDAKAAELTELGAIPKRVDLFDATEVGEAVGGHDVVYNLATSIPLGNSAARKSAWTTNHRIRRIASANLADAATTGRVQRLIQESITLLYADGDEQLLDENSQVKPTWVTASALDAEQTALHFATDGKTAVVLRFAGFYGPDSHHSVAAIQAAQNGKAAAMGPKSAYLSAVTTDDAAEAAVAALVAETGIYNISDDEPLTRFEHFSALGHAVDRQSLRFPPALLGRLAGPKLEMVLRSQRVSNQRFKDATGWQPRYPSAREGWPGVVAASSALALR